MASILIIDDEKSIRKQLLWQLSNTFSVFEAGGIDEAKTILSETPIDIALIDLHLPPDIESPRSGLDMLSYVRIQTPDVIPIIMTGINDKELWMKVIEQGAWDLFNKPINTDELAIVINRAIKVRDLANENELLKDKSYQTATNFIIGNSSKIVYLRSMIEKVAPTDATVLITGESGTGKELVATAIHQNSQRNSKSLIAVNCAALSDSLIEDELFGHESGAYTGSKGPRKGKFELADKSTLFLDEVAELSPIAQGKLLRVLQEGYLERLGSERSIQVNVRVIAATHQNLKDRVSRGMFREDLFYRLSVIPIHVPSLRERDGDIELLANYFLEYFTNKLNRDRMVFNDTAIDLMGKYTWPGNVRELKNLIERIAILSKDRVITEYDLPPEFRTEEDHTLRGVFSNGSIDSLNYDEAVNSYRKKIILHALETYKTKSKAAEVLGVNRSYLYELMIKLGIKT